MTRFKIGDKVRVLVSNSYVSYIDEGILCTIEAVDFFDSTLKLRDESGDTRWVYMLDVELVEENKEMTFPEMIQKLINGEFEFDTELTNDYDNKSYWVDTSKSHMYGLKESRSSGSVSAKLGASVINARWSVKGQPPIKEMSIEEIQKKLGHKIKIV